ncbi:flagellar basal body rod modification protein [Alkalilimnicola ehrlichii]|uniref:Basal-body rod modification protein FlgD n=1 Tax=Alkalilimnicola ehrlichii TaxID=351052 RepID=A0A3E0WZ55_9GAMM|nr:flagellar hook capping FlgD N-terminal domain-containing protein [Alkalilimnicola ehrlichii]RFA30740.1 flagellar basal body rod modification protein [Alkalilimnicola ehrlichii]RFA38316.1 flagellar basal body rod modification protein [Alkalilimnicola ehrlichii]
MVAVTNNGSANGMAGTGSENNPMGAVNIGEFRNLENTFITLLVAQIQNQDPTNPLDSSEFLNQFSTMSQVQSMENMVSMTKNNLVLLDNLQMLQAAKLVGDDVTVATERLQIGDKPMNGQIELQHPSGRTTLELTDVNGRKTTVELGAQSSGMVRFELDPEALGLAPGSYSVKVEADSGERPLVELTGTVTNVRVTPDGPLLDVAGLGQVPFYKVIEFSQGAGA